MTKYKFIGKSAWFISLHWLDFRQTDNACSAELMASRDEVG
jgi:hypothetical protein